MAFHSAVGRLVCAAGAALLGAVATSAHGFCGFYVGKADASLFNEASQVIMVRDGDRTVLSMLNDYKGDPKEFALVVPVPTVLKRGQINVGDKKIFDRLDAYSAPRLVEYFDPDPCEMRRLKESVKSAVPAPMAAAPSARRDRALGVTVEATYQIGEYDIVILSAKESDGLETWLTRNGYRIPKGASKALAPYIRQNLKFFVAKVNLKEQAKTGFTYLRPIQFAYESEKFMLPIRLGMVNATGPQDLMIYVLSKTGRIETTNYRTVKLPANMDVPVYVKGEFSAFYKALFGEQVKRESQRAVFTEYFWDMSWCDPCAADPLSPEELRSAGVFWVEGGSAAVPPQPPIGLPPGAPPPPSILPMPRPTPGGAQPVMLTRLHVRYAPDTFPEDLMFQETKDRQNFQARYVLRHAWKGDPNACQEAKTYLESIPRRHETEAQTLANLTGWNINDIRAKMGVSNPTSSPPQQEWWKKLWK
jgi:hypothetical protein